MGLGDQGAFERLYKQYYGYLYRFVYRVTRRPEFVDDVINEVMFVVWEKAAGVVPRAKASTWILGIANNKALQAVSRGRPPGNGAYVGEEEAEQISDDELAVRQLETDNLLFTALCSLAPEQRSVLELVYYHGLHYSEIAEVMDCPENTVKTRMFHARRRLRALWPSLMGHDVPDIL